MIISVTLIFISCNFTLNVKKAKKKKAKKKKAKNKIAKKKIAKKKIAQINKSR